MLRKILASLGIVALFTGTVPVWAAAPIPTYQFRQLQALIKPHVGEARWAGVPWLTDLWEARRKAAAEGKPLLMRYVNGDPLGCT
jgi:hypothetical protein